MIIGSLFYIIYFLLETEYYQLGILEAPVSEQKF